MPWLAPPAGGRFTATNIPLKLLIGLGWPQRISGGPSWIFPEGYDISAKEPDRTVSDAEFSVMMQNLLFEGSHGITRSPSLTFSHRPRMG